MLIPYKDENPSGVYPFTSMFLIAINCAIFVVFRIGLGNGYEKFVMQFGAIPWEVVHNHNLHKSPGVEPSLTIITSMFMHGSFFHLAGNMLYLWIFGNNIEDYLGHFGFFVFYLTCGVVAAMTHIMTNMSSQMPMIGASGAIAGILGAYLVLFPRARIRTLAFLFVFVTVLEVPAAVVLIMWIFVQFANAKFTPENLGGVAYWAHVGGFICGLFLVRFFPKRKGYVKKV